MLAWSCSIDVVRGGAGQIFLPSNICSKIFTKIRSVVLRKLANTQTDRQANAEYYITSLAKIIRHCNVCPVFVLARVRNTCRCGIAVSQIHLSVSSGA